MTNAIPYFFPCCLSRWNQLPPRRLDACWSGAGSVSPTVCDEASPPTPGCCFPLLALDPESAGAAASRGLWPSAEPWGALEKFRKLAGPGRAPGRWVRSVPQVSASARALRREPDERRGRSHVVVDAGGTARSNPIDRREPRNILCLNSLEPMWLRFPQK